MTTKKILIVDDDKTFQKTLSDKLISLNYDVVSAYDGKDGLNKVNSEKPDLILLDVTMPEIGGIDFLKRFQLEKIETERTPVLILTNLANMDTLSQGIALGIRGYIIKSDESLEGIASNVEAILNPTSSK
jgi:two-component system chemotaxis response regulator CheY